MRKIAVFASHNGSDLQALIDGCADGRINAKVCAVISNNADAYALERAKLAGIPCLCINTSETEADKATLDFLAENNTDIILLAGYLKKIGASVLEKYHNRIYNIHPALLPKYGGKGMYGINVHRAVIAACEQYSGVTIHRVNAEYDSGDIIAQTRVPVLEGDTPERLAERVLEREHTFLVEIMAKIVTEAEKMKTISQALAQNRYPGRGIVIGTDTNGCNIIAYFIMGRSPNSRNRVFSETPGGIQTLPFDPSKVEDPSLIIYHPVRTFGDSVIVTNGDQTDTVFAALRLGGSFESALRTRRFEPDAPNFTPRISGIAFGDGSYRLSILKCLGEKACGRQFFEYDAIPGCGRLIHTYVSDGTPLPTFEGEPTAVEITSDFEPLCDDIWNSLDNENKVSLYVRSYNPADGEIKTKIFNKNV